MYSPAPVRPPFRSRPRPWARAAVNRRSTSPINSFRSHNRFNNTNGQLTTTLHLAYSLVMNRRWILPLIAACALAPAEMLTGPPLPQGVVENWAQLPPGWNFGEVSGVDVDRNDNVWVFHRGLRPVMQFDKNGKLLQAWQEVPVKSSHGIRV